MSYIDCFKHEIVGIIAGIQIYHPLVSIINTDGSDFSCTHRDLVIGGGEGEFPGIVVCNVPAVVDYFLHYQARHDLRIDPNELTPFDEIVAADCFDLTTLSDDFKTNFHIRAMGEKCETPYSINMSLFGGKKRTTMEEWLAVSIGEFVYLSMPELHQRHGKFPKRFSHYGLFCNVTCLPPGYIKTRSQSLAETRWVEVGFTRWDGLARS